MATNKGYLRIDGLNLCYTDSFGNKHSLPYDSGYSTAVGVDKAGYIRLDETDVERIYYIDEQGTKRRTDYSTYGGANVGVDKEGSMWVGDDGYLRFVNHIGDKRKMDGTITYQDYLCFTANTAGSTVKFNGSSSYQIPAPNLQYSYDKATWTDYQYGSYAQGETLTLNNVGDKIYFRNKAETPTALSDYYHTQQFVLTGSISASGDVGFMLCRYSTDVIPEYGLKNLFANCPALTTAPKLPATVLSQHCYEGMFRGYNLLTVAPELPATTLAYFCYQNMFDGCSSLVTPPELPATTLEYGCYQNMFQNCSSLTALPELPATILTDYCYYRMFYGCSNIKLSTYQGGDYQTPYMIPINGGGTIGSNSMYEMFRYTGGDWKGTPTINQQYWTSNIVI